MLVQKDSFDPRALDPYVATQADARSGITLVPGDATVMWRRAATSCSAAPAIPAAPHRRTESTYKVGGVTYVGGESWFSLWTDHTAINLISAGGNLTPWPPRSPKFPIGGANLNSDQNMADGSVIYAVHPTRGSAGRQHLLRGERAAFYAGQR
jgi:hypothetical protein